MPRNRRTTRGTLNDLGQGFCERCPCGSICSNSERVELFFESPPSRFSRNSLLQPGAVLLRRSIRSRLAKEMTALKSSPAEVYGGSIKLTHQLRFSAASRAMPRRFTSSASCATSSYVVILRPSPRVRDASALIDARQYLQSPPLALFPKQHGFLDRIFLVV
jgi:hypothetical protein